MKWLALIVPLWACSFDTSNSIGSNDGAPIALDATGGIDAADASMLDGSPGGFGVGFESNFTQWIIPQSGGTDFSSIASASGNDSWFLIDLNGDSVLDLVQTQDPTTGDVWKTGETSYWAVFSGQAQSFSSNVLNWRVPTSINTKGFYLGTGILGSESWDTLDMDGDECPDFVRTTDPATGLVWEENGSFYWEVYLCEAFGFSEKPTIWSVPSGLYTRTDKCLGGGDCWNLTDLTGDGHLDLVHSSPDGRPWHDGPGTPHWHMYPNSFSGFAATVTEWNLPDNESSFGFFRPQSNGSGLFWRTIDINQDGMMELVQSTAFQTVGNREVFGIGSSPFWKIFNTDGDGFTAGTAWSVPTANQSGGFFAVERDTDILRWALRDLNADGHLDLLHTANPGNLVPTVWGAPDDDEWKVYLGDGVSFTSTSLAWSVPDSKTLSGFHSVSADTVGQRWALIDIDGDKQYELVQTEDPSTGQAWSDGNGGSFWRVYSRVREQ